MLVALTVGGSSYDSNNLLARWQEAAQGAEYGFCAIETGDDPRNDEGLKQLLRANVPQGASVFIVQRDANVPEEDIQQVRDLLAVLDIPLESVAVDATDLSDARSRSPFERQLSDADLFAGIANADPTISGVERRHWTDLCFQREQEIKTLKDQIEANEKTIRDDQEEEAEDDRKINELMQWFAGKGELVKLLYAPVLESISFEFTQLMETEHWKSAAGTEDVRAMDLLLQRLATGRAFQNEIEFPLRSVLHAMRDDPVLFQSVAKAAAELPIDADSADATGSLYIVYLEHQIGSGKFDDDLKTAARLARCVQRFKLLKENLQEFRNAAKQSPAYDEGGLADLYGACQKALIGVLRSEEELPLGEDVPASAADVVRAVWKDVKERGEKELPDFLKEWECWQTLVQRRQEAKRRKLEPQ